MATMDAFRVGEIQEQTKMANWPWIPTKVNVAEVFFGSRSVKNGFANPRPYTDRKHFT